MSAQGIRAGKAFVELFMNDNKFYRSLDAAKAKLQGFAGVMGSIGVKAGAAGGALLAPLAGAFKESLSRGADIGRLSAQFGETTKTISTLAGSFDIAGAGMDEFAGSIEGLKGKIKSAADANAFFDEQLQSVGTGRNLEKLPLEKQIDTLAEALRRIPDATQQAIKAQEWFGASGAKLLPYLKKGAAGIAELNAEAEKSGAIMPEDEVQRSVTASKALNTIWAELKNTVVTLGSALLPTTSETKSITESIREAFAAARTWIGENKNLIIAVAGIGAGLVAAGVAFVAFKAIILAGLAVISGGFSALGLLLTPAGLIIAGVVGLTTAFLTLTDTGKSITATLSEGFKGMGQTFSETWGAVIQLVKGGDFEGAFKIAGAGIKAIWRELLLTLRRSWNDFVKWMAKIIQDNPALLPMIGLAAGTAVGGPAGALVGLGAGIGANFVDLEGRLKADTQASEASVKEAKDELRGLIAGKVGALDGAAIDKSRFDSYGKNFGNWKAAADALPSLSDRQKGVFSGPISQQLGAGDKIAQRQLDAMEKLNDGQREMVKAVIELGKNVAVFGR